MSGKTIKDLGAVFSARPSRYRIAGLTSKKMGWPDAGIKLLEIGSGDGEAAEYMRRMFNIDVTAVEKDAFLISRSGTRALEGLKYVCGDAAALDNDDESFDAVYAEAFFSACDKAPDVIKECARVTKTGGKLVMNDFIIHNEVSESLRDCVKRIPCFRGVHTPDYWKQVFGEYGFELTEFEEDRDEFISICAWLSREYAVDPEFLGAKLAGSTDDFFRTAEMSYGRLIFEKR